MNDRLRVVRLLPVLDFGGVESRVRMLAEVHDRSAVDLTVCAFWKPGQAAEYIRNVGVPVDVLGVDPRVRNPRATLALLRYLRRTRPDVVHASIAEANLHALVAARLARIPVIVEEVGVPERSPAARRVFRRAYRLASAIVGVTPAACRYLVEVEGAPADRVRFVHNAIRPEFFQGGPPTAPVGARDDALRVLLVGRLVPVKNHLRFLEAFRRACAEVDGLSLQIAGDGPLAAETAAAAAGLPVTLLGHRDDVRDLYASCDVFALPSLSEGASISLMEAMASGRPVLPSDVPGNRETASGVDPRWFAAPDDVDGWAARLVALRRMSVAERAALGATHRAIADERFAPDAYWRKLNALYRELAR